MSRSKLEILAYEPSPLGVLCLRRRELLAQPGTFVTEVTLDHEFLMSSLNTDSERALAETALEWCEGDELRVLVGGLGLGYTAREALRSERVAQVEVVELLPQVIDWLRGDLIPLASELKADERLRVRRGDVYEELLSDSNEQYDIILIDVDHSPDDRLDEGEGVFYTEPGLVAARKHLAPDGVLGVWSYAESSPFADALHEVFARVEIKPVIFYNQLIDEEITDWLFFATD